MTIRQDIVVLTNGNYFAALILAPLLRTYRERIAGIVVVTGDYQGNRGLKALWHLARRTALPYLIYKIVVQVWFTCAARLGVSGLSVASLARELGIDLVTTSSVSAPLILAWLRNRRPQLLVSVSCPQRLGQELLAVPSVAAINVHSSLLPAYAGLAPYYWVLANGASETGTSVHYMTTRFDEGNVLRQACCSIQAGQSAFSLFTDLAKAAADLLPQSVAAALNHEPGAAQDLRRRTYCSHPTLSSYIALRRRSHRLLRVRELMAAARGQQVRPCMLATGGTQTRR